jgi:hypothetical protein
MAPLPINKMQHLAAIAANQSTSTYDPESEMNTQNIQIISATQTGDYTLRIAFDDGTTQEVNFQASISSALQPDIRAYLKPQRFAAFRIEYGELVWGDYDLCFPIIDLYKNQLEKKSTLAQAA